jgi:glucose-fructose oxidoreductase
VGTGGTISFGDYDRTVRIQTRSRPEGRSIPVDRVRPPFHNPIAYLIHCLDTGRKVEGPLSPRIARIGQQIVDSAVLSARLGRTVRLVG